MKLTDLDARQWRNRALDAERERDALRRRFAPVLERSCICIYIASRRDGSVDVETARIDAPHGSVRDANALPLVANLVHDAIRRVGEARLPG